MDGGKTHFNAFVCHILLQQLHYFGQIIYFSPDNYVYGICRKLGKQSLDCLFGFSRFVQYWIISQMITESEEFSLSFAEACFEVSASFLSIVIAQVMVLFDFPQLKIFSLLFWRKLDFHSNSCEEGKKEGMKGILFVSCAVNRNENLQVYNVMVFKENFLSDLTDKKSCAQVRICNTPYRLEMCSRAG